MAVSRYTLAVACIASAIHLVYSEYRLYGESKANYVAYYLILPISYIAMLVYTAIMIRCGDTHCCEILRCTAVNAHAREVF